MGLCAGGESRRDSNVSVCAANLENPRQISWIHALSLAQKSWHWTRLTTSLRSGEALKGRDCYGALCSVARHHLLIMSIIE